MVKYTPRYSIYCKIPKKKYMRHPLDWWIHKYEFIPVSKNQIIRNRIKW